MVRGFTAIGADICRRYIVYSSVIRRRYTVLINVSFFRPNGRAIPSTRLTVEKKTVVKSVAIKYGLISVQRRRRDFQQSEHRKMWVHVAF